MLNGTKIIEKSKGESKIIFEQDNAYFQSETHINLEKTDVKVILYRMLREIKEKLANYLRNGSGCMIQRSNQFRNSHG